MKNRESLSRKAFLEKCLSITIATGSALYGIKNGTKLFAQNSSTSSLIAVRGGTPDKLFDAAVKEMGGSLSSIISKGQTVVIKPNIGWDRDPDSGSNTNPLLVRRVVEHAFNAGAKKVYVFDNSCNYWKNAYKNSGIEQAAKDGGATLAPAHSEQYYHKITVKGAKNLKETKMHELILESDVFINIPVLKNHGSAVMTSAMKNMMGAVWDRWYFHRNDLHQCIAESCLHRKPDLNIIDAYTVMLRNGPRGRSKSDLALKKMQLVSTDMVAADMAAAKIMGYTANQVSYLNIGHKLGVGNSNLDQVEIKKVNIGS